MKRRDDRQSIKQLLNEGMSAKDIALVLDCSIPFVYLVARETGFQFTRKSKLDGLEDGIRKGINEGMTYSDLARAYKVDRSTMFYFCKAHGIENRNYADSFANAVPSIVEENVPSFEYIGGYENKNSVIQVRCSECGNTVTVTWQSIAKRYAKCPVCEKAKKQRKEEFKRQELFQRQEQRRAEKEQRERERLQQKKQMQQKKFHPCIVCGKLTDRPKYCCRKCLDKVANKKKELKRRHTIKKQMVDNDITLQSLFKRDGGVCYLCGKPCRYDDYVTKGETFIAGDWYPSIDHVKPLVKGGEHSWENVRLAHRHCNSLKAAKVYP